MLKILLTTPTYPPFNSGLGNAAAQQAASLVRAGHEVVVATGGKQRGTRKDQEGIQVETFPVSGANSLLQPIKGDQDGYVTFIGEGHWDVIIMNAWQNWATDLALKHLEKLSGKKYVYSHGISTNVFFSHQPFRSLIRYSAWRPYWWRLAQMMRKLDGVIFLADRGVDSRFDDLILARKHNIPEQIIPNSLLPAAQNMVTNHIKPVSDRNQIMAVGSYQWLKGFDFALRAYAASSACNQIPLHFFGQEHTRYSVFLEKLAKNLGVDSEFVVFHEGVSGEQLMVEYERSLVVLSGSHTECQPLALIDASATGTPFVARKTGCIPYMPGGAAVTRWQEMADHIDALMINPTRWKDLSDSAYFAATNIYHSDIVAQKLLFAVNN